MTAPVHREKAHFLPLDSIRGIAAVCVVIFHVILTKSFLAAFPQHAWIDSSFFRSAWLLVDLFFVLSGIVMSLSYVNPDFGHFSLRQFMVQRLARVYPLHIVMVFVMLLFRLVRIGLVTAGIIVAMPAASDFNNAYSFFLNVFLLHSLGFIDHLSWNWPSWSISVEFYTYLVFGLVLLWAQRFGSIRYLYAWAAFLIVSSWIAVVFVPDKGNLDLDNDFGFFRCVTSFFLGVLTVKAVQRLPRNISRGLQGGLQLGTLIAGIFLISMAEAHPWITFFAPLTFTVFLGTLLAFPDAALVPKILVAKPLVWLGRRSYSVYMVHAFVVLFTEYLVRAIGPWPVAALESICGGLGATLNLAFVLAVVFVLSNFTYHYVELPGSKLLREIFRTLPDFSGSSATPAARRAD